MLPTPVTSRGEKGESKCGKQEQNTKMELPLSGTLSLTKTLAKMKTSTELSVGFLKDIQGVHGIVLTGYKKEE